MSQDAECFFVIGRLNNESDSVGMEGLSNLSWGPNSHDGSNRFQKAAAELVIYIYNEQKQLQIASINLKLGR